MAASLRKKAELAKCVAFKTTLHGAEANVSASEMDVDDANRECDVNADTVDADDEDGDAHANGRNPNPAGDKEDTRDAHICDAQPVANVPPVLATPRTRPYNRRPRTLHLLPLPRFRCQQLTSSARTPTASAMSLHTRSAVFPRW